MKPAQDISLQLDKYELLEVLGHGGMATVYRARDRRLGRDVAIKVIHRHLRDDKEIAARFVREARAVAKLHHPNIVEVFDVSEPDEQERYLVVELVQGASLRRFLADHRTIPAEIAAALTIEVADAIEHAHQSGVIHRDIKPENVLIKMPPEELEGASQSRPPHDGGRIKITDFGIAKVLDAQGVTVTGQVLGSPSHMAPEQIEGSEVTARADVFGLGVLAYECMTGRLPFEGQNPAQVLRKVIEGRFVPVERLLPTVGVQLGRIVDRALAHDPSDRFESAAQFASALHEELERLGFESPYLELTNYLNSPARYSLEFPDRIVSRLVAAAERARGAGDVILSTSLFNRALAYKPHDSDLIAAVARLAKQRATSRRWRKLGLGTALLMGTGLIGYGGSKVYESRVSHRATPVLKKTVAATEPSALSVTAFATDDSSQPMAPQASGNAQARTKIAVPSRAASRRGDVTTSGQSESRPVQIVITGASGSRLFIDGTERPWFGVRHALSIGPHRFEVQPPNETCCVPLAPKVIDVIRGDTEQKVMLAIEFREATLFAQGPSGATLICGELFPGSLPIPGKRAVRVTKAETRARCTLLPPAASTERPKTVDVVLRPGDTFTLSG